MAKRIFKITLTADATIELDDAVFDTVDDDWRAGFYNLKTPEEIAKHIAYNLIANKFRLSQMDGWADQVDDNAKVTGIDWDVEAH